MESWNAIRSRVILLLQEYPELKARRQVIKHEWENPNLVSDDEMLSAMAYARAIGGMPPSIGHISDKTAHIAANYHENTRYQNQRQIEDLSDQLEQLDGKLYRLEYCVSQLPPDLSTLLQKLYFEKVPRKVLTEDLHMSESTLKRHLRTAIDKLTDMYYAIVKSGKTLIW